MPLNTVRAILGRKSYSMVLRYAHLAPEHQRDAVRALDRLTQAPCGDVAAGEAAGSPGGGGGSGARGHSVGTNGPKEGSSSGTERRANSLKGRWRGRRGSNPRPPA